MFIGAIYKVLVKPILFKFDPEKVHDQTIGFASWLGKRKVLKKILTYPFKYNDPILKQKILGTEFDNPIGLAAGFDKNALLTQILPELSFGYMEIGSVTAKSCLGNRGKRLWRVPEIKSLVVNYGLKNDGAKIISDRLKYLSQKIPIGISIAKTNCRESADVKSGIEDYLESYKMFRDSGVGDYYTINVSCPNAYGGEQFTDPLLLELLLKELKKIRDSKPVFIKISPDIELERVNKLIRLALEYNITGFICSNLTKNRINDLFKGLSLPDSGGVSGKPVRDLSNKQIEHIYRESKGKLKIIGVGGIYTAQDAYKKIACGASLVQLITGLIYEGPQLVRDINKGLAKILKENNFNSIDQAIGHKVKLYEQQY